MRSRLHVLLFLLLNWSAAMPALAQRRPARPLPPKRPVVVRLDSALLDPEPYVFTRADSLLLAAATNDVPLAQRLLAHGAAANRPYSDTLNQERHWSELPDNKLTLPDWTQVREGETPLLLAVRRGYLEMADLLLRHSSDQGREAAQLVLCEALHYVPNQPAIVARLLATGLPPDSVRCEQSPLSTIISYNAVMRQWLAQVRPGQPAETRAQRNRHRFSMGSRRRYEQPLHPLRPDSVNLQLLRLLLAAGTQPTVGDLHAAVRYREAGLARFLLTHGVPVNAPAGEMAVVLNEAAAQADGVLLRLLLDQGANPNVDDSEGNTPLHVAAARPDTVLLHLLLRQGAKPNVTNALRVTPLHLAATRAQSWSVGLLLAAGAAPGGYPGPPHCPDCHDGEAPTPLHAAVRAARPATVRRLLAAGAPLNACDDQQQTPVLLAVGNYPSAYVSAVDDWGVTLPPKPVEAHITRADADEVLRLLLAAGASPNVSNHAWNTALHTAVAYDDTLRVGLLLRAGANPNQLNKTGYPPLAGVRSAAVLRQLQAVGGRFGAAGSSILLNPSFINESVPLAITAAALAEGADLCELSSEGDTPLHLAAASPDADLRTAALYLAHGAEREAWNRAGATPLQKAIESQRLPMVQLLLDAGARAEPEHLVEAARVGSEAMVALLLRHGAPANYPNASWGYAALLVAVQNPAASPALVARLLEAGADPNVADSLGYSPLHLLVRWHREALWQSQQGADWSAPTVADEQARARAYQQAATQLDRRLLTLAHLLLRHGARPDAHNRAGQSVAEELRATDSPARRQLLAELAKATVPGAGDGK